MDASRRLSAFFITLALSSLSCGVVPVLRPQPDDSGGTLEFSPAQFSADAVAAARVLGRLDTGLLPRELTELAVAVATESRRAGIPQELVLAVIQVESNGNNFAMSHVGAMGLMQLMPATGEAVAERIGLRWTGPSTLFDPVSNVKLGTFYLRELLNRYGDVRTALAAYNWGPTKIARRIRRGEAVPAGYAQKVMDVFGGRAV